MNILYEQIISDMLESLEVTIENWTTAYDRNKSHSLFCVSNDKLQLLKTVSNCSDYLAIQGCKQLCIELFKEKKIEVEETLHFNKVDFVINKEKKIGFILSHTVEFMPEIEDAIAYGVEDFVNVVLKEDIELSKPRSNKYKKYPNKDKIKISH